MRVASARWRRYPGKMRKAALVAIAALFVASSARADFCAEQPKAAPPASLGRPSHGALAGARRLVADASVRLLERQAARCLVWSTPRLIDAIHRAGARVAAALPNSPPLGVGDLSRAQGGPIHAYSQSHQSGRDADLAFYQLDANGSPATAEDFVRFDARGRGQTGAGEPRQFDVPRNWALVKSLLEDPAIHLRWLFVSAPLRASLLAHARAQREPAQLLARASELLHQPSDAPPHDDHLHVRITCEPSERAVGCKD